MRTAAILLAVCALLLVAAPVSADLVWEQESIEREASAGSKSVTVEFKFRNNGPKTLAITEADAACPCMKIELPKREYAPGASGVLKAVFDIGDRSGTQLKTISVRTDDPSGWVHRLALKLTLLEPPTLTPRLLSWNKREKREPKVITLTAAGDQKLNIRSLTFDREGFESKLETVVAGRSYRIQVTPKSTREARNAALLVATDWPASEPTTFRVVARVAREEQ